MELKYKEYYKEAKDITKKFGTSYYFATKFFPEEMKLSTYALYAFFRLPDEIVDNPDKDKTKQEVLEELDNWISKWERIYHGSDEKEPVLELTKYTFDKYKIPYQFSMDFLLAMKQDLTKERYGTYQDLQDYMYGSACVVGLMMSYVIGYRDPALEYAEALGEAMQMTNFIRDISEDYFDRNRIYLPKEDLDKFQITEDYFQNKIFDGKFKELIKFEIKRTRNLYRKSYKGIKYLNQEGRFAVLMAGKLYEAILDKIEEVDYNIWLGRVKTKKREKLYILGKEIIKKF